MCDQLYKLNQNPLEKHGSLSGNSRPLRAGDRLAGHGHRRSRWCVRVEDLSHSQWHTDAPVGIRNPWKVAGMHSDSAVDPHEVRHGCAAKKGTRRFAVFHDADVSHHNVPGGVHIVAVESGEMIPILLNDAKTSRRRSISLASARNWGLADNLSGLVEKCFLSAEIDSDRWSAGHFISAPKSSFLGLGSLRLLGHNRAVGSQVQGGIAVGEVSSLRPRRGCRCTCCEKHRGKQQAIPLHRATL
jgi:hypothetical protein